MARESAVFKLSQLSAPSLGVFRGGHAVLAGVKRKQLTALLAAGIITRELPDTYRMTVVARSNEQRLRAALLWAGDGAAAAGQSAGEVYNGISDFVREFPLVWEGRTYRFDFCFEREQLMLETNGRRGHDDATDYERDNEKWSPRSARLSHRVRHVGEGHAECRHAVGGAQPEPKPNSCWPTLRIWISSDPSVMR